MVSAPHDDWSMIQWHFGYGNGSKKEPKPRKKSRRKTRKSKRRAKK
jgi:hypothetical protein